MLFWLGRWRFGQLLQCRKKIDIQAVFHFVFF
jgi:hypothetical protein